MQNQNPEAFYRGQEEEALQEKADEVPDRRQPVTGAEKGEK